MVIAEFFKRNNKLCGFCIKGHAGFADSGEDIVCASISSAVQLVANTITECFKVKADVSVLENKIQLMMPHSDENAEKMIEGLYLHLTMISEDYEGTLKIETSEV
jgi:uncharacterized protein YsxB (DUF464 family)